MTSAIASAYTALIVNLVLTVYLLYKSQRKRERLIFSSFTIFYVLNTLYYIISSEYIHSTSITPFSFQLLSNGSFVIVLFFVFPLEVLLPSYLKKRWFVLVFLIPALIYNGIWFFLCHNGMEVIHLTNVQVLLSELNNASVALRLIFFCLIILFFAASILFMLWAHNRYMTDRVLRIYAYSTIPIMGIYILRNCYASSNFTNGTGMLTNGALIGTVETGAVATSLYWDANSISNDKCPSAIGGKSAEDLSGIISEYSAFSAISGRLINSATGKDDNQAYLFDRLNEYISSLDERNYKGWAIIGDSRLPVLRP